MSLAESQRLLARLYTDAALRRRFFAEPEPVGREWGLGAQEARDLAASQEQVELFARALGKKRLRGVRQLLASTAAVLGGDLDELFSAYTESQSGARPPGGPRKIQDDALRFSDFLRRTSSNELVRAVARFEAAWIRAHAPGFRLAVAAFPFRMNEIVRQLSEGGEVRRERRPSVHVWWRLGRLRHLGVPG